MSGADLAAFGITHTLCHRAGKEESGEEESPGTEAREKAAAPRSARYQASAFLRPSCLFRMCVHVVMCMCMW